MEKSKGTKNVGLLNIESDSQRTSFCPGLFKGIEWGTIQEIKSERISEHEGYKLCSINMHIKSEDHIIGVAVIYIINSQADYIFLQPGEKVGIEYKIRRNIKDRYDPIPEVLMRCHIREYEAGSKRTAFLIPTKPYA